MTCMCSLSLCVVLCAIIMLKSLLSSLVFMRYFQSFVVYSFHFYCNGCNMIDRWLIPGVDPT